MLFFLILLTLAQTPCDLINFDVCLESNNQFLDFTCAPLFKFKDECFCYAAVARVNCYSLCSSNSTLQSQLSQVSRDQVSLCKIANLTSPLPQPAPWVTFVAPPVASTAPPTQTGVAIRNNADSTIHRVFGLLLLAVGFY